MSTHDATETRADSRDLFADVEQAIAMLQQHEDARVREAVDRLLAGVDAVHRAGLSHLVHALQAIAGDALINRLVADPAIRILLMSYDLIAVDRRLQAEEALDRVRGHLHDHGIDVELADVLGGVVYVRLHGTGATGSDLPLERVRADLEAALKEWFIGFQELEFRDGREGVAPAVVPLHALRRANRPVYQDAIGAGEVEEGCMRAAVVNETGVVFVRVGGEIYAVRDQCGDSPLPLHLGTLRGAEITCPWHGCRYDVRTGARLDAAGRVPVVPIRVEAGRVRVAVDVAAGTG